MGARKLCLKRCVRQKLEPFFEAWKVRLGDRSRSVYSKLAALWVCEVTNEIGRRRALIG